MIRISYVRENNLPLFMAKLASFVVLVFLLQSTAYASPLARLFKEALDGVVETPYFASRGIRKGVAEETDSKGAEELLKARLEAIPEETGKMANSISNLIFIYNTPEQKLVLQKEYQRIKTQFSEKVQGANKAQAKLVFLTNLKCSAYALDLLSSFNDALVSRRELSTYREPIRDLGKCSEMLRRVKGYHPQSVEGYEKLAINFLPLFEDVEALDAQKRQEVSLFISILLSAMKGQYVAVEKAGREWF